MDYSSLQFSAGAGVPSNGYSSLHPPDYHYFHDYNYDDYPNSGAYFDG